MDPATIALTFRRVLLSGILGLALLIPASIIPWPGSAATCAAASSHRVAVVVQHGDGSTLSRCVSFTGASIKATTALEASGIDWRGSDPVAGLGVEVCQVDGEPATYDPTNCLKSSKPFWALFELRDGGTWQPASQGASSLTFSGGDAFGLRYQPQAIPLHPPTVVGDCPAPTPPPTPKPTPKPTAQPTKHPPAPPGRTPTPVPPSPGAPGAPGAPSGPATSPTPTDSATDGVVAVATALPDPSSTPEPAVTSGDAAPRAADPTPALDAPASTPDGSAPLGLVLVAVAGLAFAALGVLHVRRSP